METRSIIPGVHASLALGKICVEAAQRIAEILKLAQERNRLPADLEIIQSRLPIVTDQIQNGVERMERGLWSPQSRELLQPIYIECQKMIVDLTNLIEEVRLEEETIIGDQLAKAHGFNIVQEAQIKRISHRITQLSDSLSIHNSEVLVDATLAQMTLREEARQRPYVYIPYERNEEFVGRRNIIEDIEQKLISHRRVVLSGLGGVGKTEIASEFCWRYQSQKPNTHIFWLTATNPSSIREGYKGIARRVGLPNGMPEFDEHVFETVADWLKQEENQPWLIILDNADDLDTFKNGPDSAEGSGYNAYLSSMAYRLPGETIITTRNSQVCRQIRCPGHIVVEPLPISDAVELLGNQMPTSSMNIELLENVVTRLDQLPLAITQAARYMSETNDTVTSYLKKLEDSDSRANLLMEDFGSDRRDEHQKNSVFGTWEISFDQVRTIRPRAAEILSLMSVLSPQMVSKKLLQDEDENDVQFQVAVATLLSFSLVKTGPNSDDIQMHPLIHQTTRMWIGKSIEELYSYRARALRHIEKLYPEIEKSHRDDWDLVHALQPHAKEVLGYSFGPTEEMHHARLLVKVAEYDLSQGRSEQAHTKYLKALGIYEQSQEQGDIPMLKIFHALGNVLCDLGQYNEALEYLEKAWDGIQALQGDTDARSLDIGLMPSIIVNSFGLLYRKQDLDEEAEKHFRAAYHIAKQVSGLDHPHTLISGTNLADVLRSQNKLQEAEVLHREMIERQKEILGLTNSVTLASMENFMYLLSDLGRYEEAIEVHQHLEYGKEILYGKSHRHQLIRNKEALAYVFELRADHDQADHQKTLDLRQEAYEAYKMHYGEEHIYTLSAGQTTARSMFNLKLTADAEKLGRRVHQALERRYGSHHHQTLSTLGEVITYIREQGRFGEAERMRRQQLDTLEATRGADDVEIFYCCESLANTIQHQYRFRDAIPFFQRAYDGFCRRLGENHEDAQGCLRKLELARGNLEKEQEGLSTDSASDEDALMESLTDLQDEENEGVLERIGDLSGRAVEKIVEQEAMPISPALEEVDLERYFHEDFHALVSYIQ